MFCKAIVPPRNEIYEKALGVAKDPWLARVLSLRLDSSCDEHKMAQIIQPDLTKLMPDISRYGDMNRAAERVADAIINREKIVCAVDFDSDGINSGAIFARAMREVFWLPEDRFHVQVSHRIQWGYGYTEYAVRNIFREHQDDLPSLILTADQGSSNEEQVKLTYALAKEHGHVVDVVVTDHHEIPGDGPTSAYAFINPQKDEVEQDMKDVCGATVLWFLLVRTYQILESRGCPLPPGSKQKLFELIAHCAIATISDVMSLASPLNRGICKTGFHFINTSKHPAWEVLRKDCGDGEIDEEYIGFNVAPKINSASRIGLSGKSALSFLAATSVEQAAEQFALLADSNEERKDIGAEMMDVAIEEAEKQVSAGRFVIVVYLPDGTPGVSGIVAGRLKERFSRPAIMMSPSSESQATGSARSIPSLNIRDCLQEVHDRNPELLPKFGGHPMAAGMSVPIHMIDEFADTLDRVVKSHLDQSDLVPLMEVDFDLSKLGSPMSIGHVKRLNLLKPFGQKFPHPTALIRGRVTNFKAMGKKAELHARFNVVTESGHIYSCVWFNMRASEDKPWLVEEGVIYSFVVQPSINAFRGRENLQFSVVAINQ